MKNTCALLAFTTVIYSATPEHTDGQNEYTATSHNTPTDQPLPKLHETREQQSPVRLLQALKAAEKEARDKEASARSPKKLGIASPCKKGKPLMRGANGQR